MEPKNLYCCEYHKCFIFSVGEQEFYKEKELETPRHCPVCREKRKRGISDPYDDWKSTMAPDFQKNSAKKRVKIRDFLKQANF